MYHASAAVFEGVKHTMTADGLTEVETEEGAIITEERIGFSNPFASTFFDFECLLANGTGDPCDAHVAEAFADQMFVPLRMDTLVGLWLSTIFLYSLAQIGGIPRPRFVDRRIDWTGVVFWLSWMTTQACQFLVVGLALAMQIVAFFGVHERTGPCLVRVDNSTLLDEYAMVTFAAQPALLSKLLLLVVYGYLLSLGALVFIGRNMNEVDFKEEASKTNTRLVQPIPLPSVLYFISRWALYGICLGTVGGWLGWPAALVAAAVGSLTGGFRRGQDWRSRATIAKCTLGVLLGLPILPNLVYLPLGALFLAFVKLSFAAGRRSLDLIASTDKLNWTRCKRAEALTRTAAAATKPAISWLAPLGSLELTNGMSMAVQGLDYTETSLSTLAGGLACVLGCLALSPLVAYGTWAAEQGRLEPGYDVEDSAVDAVQARPWMLWLLVVTPVVLCAVEFFLEGEFLAKRCHDRGIYLSLTSDSGLNVLLTFYAIPFLLALGFAIFFTSLDDSFIERIIWHAQVCYADSFAFLATLQLDVSGLQPFIDSVVAGMVAFTGDPLGAAQKVADRLAEIVADPLAPVREVVEVVANMSRYLDIDPSYFVEHSAALDVLNVALGLLKLLATYGRKAFALYDVVRGLFSGENEEGNEEDDGVVQVHECVADPTTAQVEADFELLCPRGDYSDDKTSLGLSHARLTDGDVATIALWLKHNAVLTKLDLSGNPYSSGGIGPEGASAIAEALKGNGVLTSLEVGFNSLTEESALGIVRVERQRNKLISLGLGGCSIGPTGAAGIAEYVSGSGVLKSLDISENMIGDEGASAIAETLRGNAVLASLDVGYNKLTEEAALGIVRVERQRNKLTSLGLARCNIGQTGAAEIAEFVSGSGVLKSLNLRLNDIRDEGAAAIADALAVNGVLTKLNLDGHELDLPKLRGTDSVISLDLSGKRLGPASLIVIASLIAGNEVLTSIDLRRNNLGDVCMYKGKKAIQDAVSGREGFKLEL